MYPGDEGLQAGMCGQSILARDSLHTALVNMRFGLAASSVVPIQKKEKTVDFD